MPDRSRKTLHLPAKPAAEPAAKPAAKACPPKRVNSGAHDSSASSRWNASMDRPEPWPSSPSRVITSAGLFQRSTTRVAAMPIQHVEELALQHAALQDAIEQIRPVERADELDGIV